MSADTAMLSKGESALAFRAAGVETHTATDPEKLRATFKKLLTRYKVIFVTDDVAFELDDLIKRTLEQPYPVIVPVPSDSGRSEYAQKQIREQTERALGVDIFNK